MPGKILILTTLKLLPRNRSLSFNVLNFFTTLGSRGAETEEQREDQLEKITAGVVALNADVIGIEEVENDYDADTPTIEVRFGRTSTS